MRFPVSVGQASEGGEIGTATILHKGGQRKMVDQVLQHGKYKTMVAVPITFLLFVLQNIRFGSYWIHGCFEERTIIYHKHTGHRLSGGFN